MKDHAERADACEAREAVMLEDMSAMRDKLASHADTIAALREGLESDVAALRTALGFAAVRLRALDANADEIDALLASSNPGERVQAELTSLRRVVAEVLKICREGDLDGGDAQDLLERAGFLARVEATESCGEGCRCAEYGDFPQSCYRPTKIGKVALEARALKPETGDGDYEGAARKSIREVEEH